MTAALGLSLFLVDCLDTRSDARRDGGSGNDPADAGDAGDAGDPADPVEADVTVDVAAERAVVAAYHYGMHSSVYDNALHHESLPELLEEAGIGLLRWPGGGYPIAFSDMQSPFTVELPPYGVSLFVFDAAN